jgi:hypothetical protein
MVFFGGIMPAQIRSSIPSKPVVDDASRDDLEVGDVVTVEAVPPALGTTWAWTLTFVPEGSAAVLTPPSATTTSGPMVFTVDLVGPYLLRLVVDAGLPSESTQYVRLRALTDTLGLKLVAAGERRDSSGVIPVDADIEGWANDQNANLQALESALNQPGIVYHLPATPIANGTYTYRGWVPVAATLVSVRAYTFSLNTQGAFDLDVLNTNTGNSCLFGGNVFDMNGLTADNVEDVALTTGADLSFLAKGRWDVTLTSDDPGFDGEGVYIELVFEVVR